MCAARVIYHLRRSLRENLNKYASRYREDWVTPNDDTVMAIVGYCQSDQECVGPNEYPQEPSRRLPLGHFSPTSRRLFLDDDQARRVSKRAVVLPAVESDNPRCEVASRGQCHIYVEMKHHTHTTR